jgi:hypothetical protein
LTIRGGRSGGTGRPAPAIAAPTNGLGGFPPPPAAAAAAPPPPADLDCRCGGGGAANALACALVATARPAALARPVPSAAGAFA